MLDVYDFHINPAELLGYSSTDCPDMEEVLSLLEDQLYEVDYFDVPYNDVKIERHARRSVAVTVSINGMKAWGNIEYSIKTGRLTAKCDGFSKTAKINIQHPGFKDVHEAIAWICKEFSKLIKEWAGVSIA